eukprot:PhF_6_TR42873/c2_g3_i1/m.64953
MIFFIVYSAFCVHLGGGITAVMYNQDGMGYSGTLTKYKPFPNTVIVTGEKSWPTGFTKDIGTFYGGVYDGNKSVWMIPNNADRVIRINTSTGAMTGYNAWPLGYTKNADAFYGGV